MLSMSFRHSGGKVGFSWSISTHSSEVGSIRIGEVTSLNDRGVIGLNMLSGVTGLLAENIASVNHCKREMMRLIMILLVKD